MGRVALAVVAAGLAVVGRFVVCVAVCAVCVAGTAGVGLAEAVDTCRPLSNINADTHTGLDIRLGVAVDSGTAFRAVRIGDRLKAAPAEMD